MNEEIARGLLRKRFDSVNPGGSNEEFEGYYMVRSQDIQNGFRELYPEGTDKEFADYAKKVEKDWKIQDAVKRKCDQCGNPLDVCIWGYPVFSNLPPHYRIMGCVIGPDDRGKNWWCPTCETYFS